MNTNVNADSRLQALADAGIAIFRDLSSLNLKSKVQSTLTGIFASIPQTLQEAANALAKYVRSQRHDNKNYTQPTAPRFK